MPGTALVHLGENSSIRLESQLAAPIGYSFPSVGPAAPENLYCLTVQTQNCKDLWTALWPSACLEPSVVPAE